MEENQDSPGEPEDSRAGGAGDEKSGGCLGRFLFVLGALLAIGLAVFLAMAWIGQRAIESTSEGVKDVVRMFQPEQVIASFEEWREMEVTGTDGNILEIATAESTETFSRKTAIAMFGRNLPLGTTVSEITVPATYRYHIDLDGQWFLTSDGNRLLVLAPRVEPTLPVAFDTGKMQKKTNSGWARWDGAENLAELEKTVTEKLAGRASDVESLQKARDAGRRGVANFVQKWLISREAWEEKRFEEIVVLFEGEEGKSLTSMPSTLRVGGEEDSSESGDTGEDEVLP